MSFYYLFLLFTLEFCSISTKEEHGKDCTTPDGYPGTCQDIRNCQPLLSLYRGLKSDSKVKNYLLESASKCLVEGSFPTVCCLKNGRSAMDEPENICGKVDLYSQRLLGSIDTTPGEFPWMVALGYIHQNNARVQFGSCGGSLISDRWVLTAAHCVNQEHRILEVVRVGEYDLNKNDKSVSTSIDIPVDGCFKHEKASKYRNDIALIRLWTPVTFTKFIRPICIFETVTQNSNPRFTTIGWGEREKNTRQSNPLQKAEITIISNAQCNELRKNINLPHRIIPNMMFCSSDPTTSICKGDSGSPVMIKANRRYHLVGINTAGMKECVKNNSNLGIYTNVTTFEKWIRETIRNNSLFISNKKAYCTN